MVCITHDSTASWEIFDPSYWMNAYWVRIAPAHRSSKSCIFSAKYFQQCRSILFSFQKRVGESDDELYLSLTDADTSLLKHVQTCDDVTLGGFVLIDHRESYYLARIQNIDQIRQHNRSMCTVTCRPIRRQRSTWLDRRTYAVLELMWSILFSLCSINRTSEIGIRLSYPTNSSTRSNGFVTKCESLSFSIPWFLETGKFYLSIHFFEQ